MNRLPESTRVAVDVAVASLRLRADALAPDEDLVTSIALNARVADDFAVAYALLREIGLEDRLLDRFGVENATASEMREAAEVMARLATSDSLGMRKRAYPRVRMAVVREFRVFAIILTTILSIILLGLGTLLFLGGLARFEEWREDGRVAVHVVSESDRAVEPTTSLAPVTAGWERTVSGRIVPPRPRDFVCDRAGILSSDAARTLNARLARFERETSNQLVVFIDRRVPAGTTLEELGTATIAQWGVGQRDKDNGVILFVFVDDRTMRIEVGYGLEGVLTDARSKRITSQVIKPYFQASKFAEGIDAGSRAIMDVTQQGDAALDYAVHGEPRRGTGALVTFFCFALSLACFGIVVHLVRALVLFLQGYGTSVFRFAEHSGRGSGASGSDGGSGSSGSSGSYSSGGGSGGGGGASDSW